MSQHVLCSVCGEFLGAVGNLTKCPVCGQTIISTIEEKQEIEDEE